MFIESYIFWENFWPNLLSDSIVVVIFSFFIIWFLDFIKKPKNLEIICNATRNNIIKAVKKEDCYFFSTQLVIKHMGGRLWNPGSPFIKEIYWHLLIPEDIKIELEYFDLARQPKCKKLEDKINHKVYLNITGNTYTPLYSKSFLELNFKIKGIFKNKGEISIYYYFNTEFGRYPNKIIETDDINLIKKTYKKLKIVIGQ